MRARAFFDWSLIVAMIAAIIFAAFALFGIRALAQSEPSAEDRAAFFLRMKNAQLVGKDYRGQPRIQDCCGPADWTLVKVIGTSPPDSLIVEVTDPRRHKHAKKGTRIVVPRSAFVRGDASPWGVPGLFVSDSPGLHPYCFVGAGGS